MHNYYNKLCVIVIKRKIKVNADSICTKHCVLNQQHNKYYKFYFYQRKNISTSKNINISFVEVQFLMHIFIHLKKKPFISKIMSIISNLT